MVKQTTRDFYFTVLRPLLWLNHWRWRLQGVGGNGRELHLHLGCGTKYLRGFVNIDGNLFRKSDLVLDLRHGLPLPDNSVRSIYSSHVFEHFYPDDLQALLRECHRVLCPGGGMRIVVPDMQAAVVASLTGRADFFTDFPRPHRSLGGKLSNLLFCEGGHRQGLDFSYLQELLTEAGFREVQRVRCNQTRIYSPARFAQLEQEEVGVASISLFVETWK
jgi:predicted SAM-dependent methyltransferase